MQVSNVNDVKIYNLSYGKSLPEWLSDRKKRALQKKDVDVQRRIELIQDFDMPTVCTNLKVSRDGQYIIATGTYKPRVRCYDTYQLSLKFERCLDSEVVKFDILSEDYSKGLPSVSALKFSGPLHLAVGTSTGQVLVYDLRSNRPLIVKDHQYGLPIKSIQFHDPLELIISSDSRIIKMWNKDNGKAFTSIEPKANINDVCLYPNSGMLFTGNEAPKMNVYYIPALGPAPRWCSFLDNLTEELEENPESTVYDDYKFVTKKDLDDLGKHVKAMVNPFAYEEYKREKIRQKIEEARAQRVQIKKLPKVNKDLALKLLEEEEEERPLKKKKQKKMPNILSDDRFKVMFENPDYQVDEQSEEFRLLNPLVSKVSEKRKKKLKAMEMLQAVGKLWKTLEDRLKVEEKLGTLNVSDTAVGSKQLTFQLKKSEQQKKRQEAEKQHKEERKKLRRSAGHLRSKQPARGRPFR
ncbi:hypothetical protein GDO78_002105 [Eleutherodactylus coqui]|uniref:Nucleolar protein 10 n=1 Tax=Eleutherodactylus coqui TaxID=57060 RepID=A0A8J6FVC0_ELECQ|nr:hypothetical protein GDO78_002105 [Eleutherodactylus coqui]